MKKFLSSLAFAAVIATGMCTVSCQQDAVEEISPKQEQVEVGMTESRLIEVMSSDPIVQEFIQNNEVLLQRHDTWYNSLSKTEKQARKAQRADAQSRGVELEDVYITKAELVEHWDNQQSLANAIRSKYKQFASADAQVQQRIRTGIITNLLGSTSSATTDGPGPACHAGYNDCSWYCYDHGRQASCYAACRAGYDACMENQTV